jgi:DNA-directed RNA polymerase subunit RPC12/RpoP
MMQARQRKSGKPSPIKPRRFFDTGAKFNYSGDMLVNCPKCGSVGRIRYVEPSGDAGLTWQFTCSRCSHRIVSRAGGEFRRSGNYPYDPYLGLRLHLQVPTRHGVLFAYNEDHLDAIEGFVAAELRERRRGELGWSKSSMVRLPPWVKSAKNREDVLRALARLRRRLVDAM